MLCVACCRQVCCCHHQDETYSYSCLTDTKHLHTSVFTVDICPGLNNYPHIQTVIMQINFPKLWQLYSFLFLNIWFWPFWPFDSDLLFSWLKSFFYCIILLLKQFFFWFPWLAQAKWSKCWYQREATSPPKDLWEVPQQTSDGEDIKAALRLHRTQNQVQSNHYVFLWSMLEIWTWDFTFKSKIKI